MKTGVLWGWDLHSICKKKTKYIGRNAQKLAADVYIVTTRAPIGANKKLSRIKFICILSTKGDKYNTCVHHWVNSRWFVCRSTPCSWPLATQRSAGQCMMYWRWLSLSKVHYLSLDIEGGEMGVLTSLPWHKLDIWLLSVEVRYPACYESYVFRLLFWRNH